MVRNPSLKLAWDVNSTTLLALCVQMKKEGDGKDKK